MSLLLSSLRPAESILSLVSQQRRLEADVLARKMLCCARPLTLRVELYEHLGAAQSRTLLFHPGYFVLYAYLPSPRHQLLPQRVTEGASKLGLVVSPL
jgi:hypothetical protein